MRSFSKLPGRAPFYGIAHWLAEQARGNGAEIRIGDGGRALDAADGLRPRRRRDRRALLGATASRARPPDRCPGAETGRCVAWDAVALGKESPSGNVLVIDDLQDAAAPLTAIKLAEEGSSVRLVTRWPMFGMETIPEVYFIWIQSRLYEAACR